MFTLSANITGVSAIRLSSLVEALAALGATVTVSGTHSNSDQAETAPTVKLPSLAVQVAAMPKGRLCVFTCPADRDFTDWRAELKATVSRIHGVHASYTTKAKRIVRIRLPA